MKFLIFTLMFSTLTQADPKVSNKKEVKKEKVALEKLKILEKEDCDEKAKKPVEIKPESISLSGNTGCSLDDAH
jgi:hypothetical protein